MKFLTLFTVLVFTNLTIAAPKKIGKCLYQDYQRINRALKKYEIRAGSHLINRVMQIMAQEVVPRCSVFATVEGNALTGQTYAYELDPVTRELYDITIVEGAKLEADSISIQQIK